MPRPKPTTPTADEIRCPTCDALDWRRLGERIVLEAAVTATTPRPVHHHVNEDGPLDWTCERCGQRVKAASPLDHRLARVQAPVLQGAGGVAGAGGLITALWQRLSHVVDRAPAAAATALVAVVVVGGGAWYLAGARAVAPSASPSAVAPISAPAAVATSLTASAPAAVATTPGVITDLDLLANAADVSLAGRPVELDAAPVQAVTGDVTFWLGRSGTQRVFVVLDESVRGEAAVTVRKGQRLRVRGTVVRTPVHGDDLSGDDRAALRDEPIYLEVSFAEAAEVPGRLVNLDIREVRLRAGRGQREMWSTRDVVVKPTRA